MGGGRREYRWDVYQKLWGQIPELDVWEARAPQEGESWGRLSGRGREGERDGTQRELGTEGGRDGSGEVGGAPVWDSASSHRQIWQVSLKYSVRDTLPLGFRMPALGGFSKVRSFEPAVGTYPDNRFHNQTPCEHTGPE